MRWQVAVAFVAACLLGADSPDEAAKKDIEKWQGAWRAVSMVKDGKSAPEGELTKIKLTVKGTDYHFQNGSFSEHGSYRFNASANPKELDIVVGEGADKGKIYKVVYSIEGDQLVICVESANKNRPKELSSNAGSGNVLETWRRMKP